MKDIDSVSRLQYWLIFYHLTPSCVIFATVVYFFIGWAAVPAALLINILFPFLLRMLAGRAAEWFVDSCMGSGYSSATRREQLDAELNRVRHFKSQKYFLAALETVNSVLVQMPEHPQALLLKAQILHEGFNNCATAKECLRKIIYQEPNADAVIRQWAATLLDEIKAQQKKAAAEAALLEQ